MNGEAFGLEVQSYVPVSERVPLAALVYCTGCGSVVVGDAAGQTIHDAWHRGLTRVEDDARWARSLRPLAGRPNSDFYPGADQ